MTEQHENLFAYGTLLDPVIQQEVIGRTLEGKLGRLHDFEKTAVRIGDSVFPSVRHKKGSWVLGQVFSVTPDELVKIDAYETTAYRREKIALMDNIEAFIYIPRKK